MEIVGVLLVLAFHGWVPVYVLMRITKQGGGNNGRG